MLDLDGDKAISLRELDPDRRGHPSSVLFDWNGDGLQDDTAWIGPSDGMLVIDLAGDGSSGADGRIDQAHELAFTRWVDEGEDGKDAEVTDMEALRLVFDTNHDNILSALDDRWNEFRVWQDLNQNGVSEAGELRTMSDAGISLINLVPSSDGAQTFADGSMITGTSTYQTVDGRQHLAADAALAWRAGTNGPPPLGS